jgi:GMT-like wHTH domain
MKDIMAKASSYQDRGVASFSYCPGDEGTPLLMEFARPLSRLGETLLGTYAGQTLTMQQVYEGHHVDRPFIKKNYKDVLAMLEAAGKIEAYPPASQRVRQKGAVTFADGIRIRFPAVK